MSHTTFSTWDRGLQRKTPPMILFEKAKRYGIWNPSEIDFSQDVRDWAGLSPEQRDLLLRLTSLFVAGEEAVTLDLLPLIGAVAREGRLEEEMYLTTFLWEEAKHVDFFSRFLAEVCGEDRNLARFQGPCYSSIICDALPAAMSALQTEASPANLARASAVYNMVVEGMLAETGYHAYFTIMDRYHILPGQREGITKLKQDESRHIAYGVYLLSRLMAEDSSLWEVVESTMNELLPAGLGVVHEIFSSYDPVPFDIDESEFLAYAGSQFQKRLDRVRRAREMTLEELNRETQGIIDTDDA